MIYPDIAIIRLVDYHGLSKRTGDKAAVLHTNGFDPGTGSLFAAFSRNADGSNGPDFEHVGAHFQVMASGIIEQYIDTDFSIGHAWDANPWTVGIETEDKGKCETAWTKSQVDSIVKLLKKLGIPAQVLKETPSDGVGWHRQYDSWNKSNHSCPCNTRQDQITEDILPGLEDDMGLGEDYFKALSDDGLTANEWSAAQRYHWGWQRGRRFASGATGQTRPDEGGVEQQGWDDGVAWDPSGGGQNPVEEHTHIPGGVSP